VVRNLPARESNFSPPAAHFDAAGHGEHVVYATVAGGVVRCGGATELCPRHRMFR
jgi:hypothetical protein